MNRVCQQSIGVIRQEFFDGQVEQALADTIKLLETLVADQDIDQQAVGRVATAILSAMEDNDYLLVADLVYFEIPDLWEN